MLKKFAILVAGGAGKRMGSELPKQFLELSGLPIIMHSMLAFRNVYSDISIIVVLPEDQVKSWKELCEKHRFFVPHQITAGGETRFHSVHNGLNQIEEDGLVAIHDGVRPFVSKETIVRCFEAAALYGNAIPVMEVVETVRFLDDQKSRTIDRSKLRLVQTPQVFKVSLIKEAFIQPYKSGFTDDASVLESFGGTVHLVEGNKENIKITHPGDLVLGEYLLRLNSQPPYSPDSL